MIPLFGVSFYMQKQKALLESQDDLVVFATKKYITTLIRHMTKSCIIQD